MAENLTGTIVHGHYPIVEMQSWVVIITVQLCPALQEGQSDTGAGHQRPACRNDLSKGGAQLGTFRTDCNGGLVLLLFIQKCRSTAKKFGMRELVVCSSERLSCIYCLTQVNWQKG